MRIYDAGFTVQRKEDDSPLTQADLESQRVIIEGLQTLTPDVPILSEESATAPLGPAPNLAGVMGGRSLGRHPRVHQAQRRVHGECRPGDRPRTGAGGGVRSRPWALLLGGRRSRRIQPSPGRARAPHSYLPAAAPAPGGRQPFTRQRRDRRLPPEVGSACHDRHRQFTEILPGGRGSAELYPRFGPTSEWDTAAGQALLEAAGGHVTRLDGHRLRYNCRDSVINGDFLAFSHSSVLPPP